MGNLVRDVRFAISRLWRSPGTTAVIVVTLALGIGANSAIFSLFSAIVLRPLPVPQSEELVRLTTVFPDSVNGDSPFTFQMFQELRRRQNVLSDLIGWGGGVLIVAESEGRQFNASIDEASGEYYKTMRIAPRLGRFIDRSDVALESGVSNAVAVITSRLWREYYHEDPNVIGKTIRLDAQPFTIVGVAPESFTGLRIETSADVTIPLFSPDTSDSRDPKKAWLGIVGRLRPGVTLAQAQAQLETIWPAVLKDSMPPGLDGAGGKRFFTRRIKIDSAAYGISYLRTHFSRTLNVLLILVGVLLLIACLNLANLSIAKMASERHSWSVKLALGAGPWALIRPILVESFIASLIGALLGLVIAYWAAPLLLNMAWSGALPVTLSTTPDVRVVLFTGWVTVLTTLLFAIVPALQAAHAEALTGLRQNARTVQKGSTLLGKMLLATQVALSLTLVAGALLFATTLIRLHTFDVGYQRDHLLTLLLLPQPGVGDLQNRTTYYRNLADKVASIPGVKSVSLSSGAPASEVEFPVPVSASPDSDSMQAVDEMVAPEFFATVGVHVLAGREFTWSDDEQSPHVAVISKKLAERLYGRENPLGRDLYWNIRSVQQKLRVIGVVTNARLWKVESPEPQAVFRSYLQSHRSDTPVMDVRTSFEPARLKAVTEHAVRSLGYHYSFRTQTVDERLDSRLTSQRLLALLAVFFAIVALLIAAIGLYGLTSFQVAQRIPELAVRLALGAQTRNVLSMVLREVLLVAGLGCLIGLVASVSLRSYVSSILFDVSATDPVLLSSAAVSLLCVALLSGLLPARRAAAVDPAVALRGE